MKILRKKSPKIKKTRNVKEEPKGQPTSVQVTRGQVWRGRGQGLQFQRRTRRFGQQATVAPMFNFKDASHICELPMNEHSAPPCVKVWRSLVDQTSAADRLVGLFNGKSVYPNATKRIPCFCPASRWVSDGPRSSLSATDGHRDRLLPDVNLRPTNHRFCYSLFHTPATD